VTPRQNGRRTAAFDGEAPYAAPAPSRTSPRTCDLGARLDGCDLVSADGPGFARGIGLWFLLAIPSTYTNAMVRPSKAYVLAEAVESLSCCCHACARFAIFNRNSPCDGVLVLPDIYTISTFPQHQTPVTTTWAAKEDLRELTSTCEPPGHRRPLTDLVLDTLRPT
jgi:hypothetical protein